MRIQRALMTTGLLLMLAGLLVSGCGEKIAIPQPKGLFSVSAYLEAGTFDVENPRQVSVIQGGVYLLQATTLSKADQGLNIVEDVPPVTGFGDATALCGDAALGQVFVFDQADRSVSWYSLTDLTPLGSAVLDSVDSAVSMVLAYDGLEQVPGALAFLYLGDPQKEVIHRYAFDPVEGLTRHGILANSTGQSARFVHQVQGMGLDPEGNILVCDADTTRNWVIRFDSTPDETDATPNEDDEDLLRGLAITFRTLPCEPQPVAAYVLGDAPDCGETDWEGGTSDEHGAFNQPAAVAIDGDGMAYVADRGNNRVQLFYEGEWTLTFVINPDGDSAPTHISVVDRVVNPNLTHFGAYVFVVVAGDDQVRKYVSYEEYQRLNPGAPPPPQ